jgi:uncharacterized protein YprB with RNaseH-like and TPR domain
MIFTCPYCTTEFTLSPEYLDSKLECPQCANCFQLAISSIPAPAQIFLDIETTGFSPSYSQLTTVVWFGDGLWGHWVNDGRSTDALTTAWNNSKELITFNGIDFDEPWLMEALNVSQHTNHVDLRDGAASQGLSGGLKKISENLGIPRPPELSEIEGKDAPKLWHAFTKGNKCALCNLLYYNAWDVVLTYNLHCHLNQVTPTPIQNTIPFANHENALKSIIGSTHGYRRAFPHSQNKHQRTDAPPSPETDALTNESTKPKASSRHRHYISKKDLLVLWEARKKAPLTSLDEAFICFTGDLKTYEREAAEEQAVSLGAIVKNSAVQRLDFLIVGDMGGSYETTKCTTAKRYINKGAHTQIVDETRFIELIHATKDPRP